MVYIKVNKIKVNDEVTTYYTSGSTSNIEFLGIWFSQDRT